MEEQFITAWLAAREKAALLGIKLRPLARDQAMQLAHRSLQGRRESEGFGILADKKRLDLSLEALAVDKRFGALFSDEEANNALTRLLDAGYYLRYRYKSLTGFSIYDKRSICAMHSICPAGREGCLSYRISES